MKIARLFAIALCSLLLAGCSLSARSTDYPLAAPGGYHVGILRLVQYLDASRAGREVTLTLWYPTQAAGAEGITPLADAAPEQGGAPHALLLTSTNLGIYFGPHLASHGFLVAGVNGQDTKATWGEWMIDYPLDLLFALDRLAEDPPQGFQGLIDTDQAGTLGYSFDSLSALALAGARVDPEYYLAQCAGAATARPALPDWWIEYICTPAQDWQAFGAHAGTGLTTSEDGLWQAMTDERIRASMPMAPEGAWLFGERGLQAADRPVLLIGAAEDTINPYDVEACFMYRNLGHPDRMMITFLGQDHMMIWEAEMLPRMQHFAAAFFGYHLQGKVEYAEYFSRQFVRQHEGLDWGIH